MSWSSTLISGTEKEKSLVSWGFFHDDNTWLMHGWSTRDTALRKGELRTKALLEALSWPHEHCSENCTRSQQSENILLENNQTEHTQVTGHCGKFHSCHRSQQNTERVSLGQRGVAISDVKWKLQPQMCEFLKRQL